MIFKTVATDNPHRSCRIQSLGYEAVMENRLDELFFKSDSSYQRHSMNKISWRRYWASLFVVLGAISLGLVGIFFSSVFYSVISIIVLGILAVMSAIK